MCMPIKQVVDTVCNISIFKVDVGDGAKLGQGLVIKKTKDVFDCFYLDCPSLEYQSEPHQLRCQAQIFSSVIY